MNVQVSTVVMMLVLGSLALIGIGTTILIDDNQRLGLVAEYNEGVEAFAVSRSRLMRTDMSIGTGSSPLAMTRFEGSEPIGGFTGDLPAPGAATYGWTAEAPAQDTFTVNQVIDGSPATPPTIDVPRLAVNVPSSTELSCTSESFDRSTGNCPDAFLQQKCHEISGDPTVGTVTKHPGITGACPMDTLCGTCDFVFYLNTRVEYVVWLDTPSPGRWALVENLGWKSFPRGVRYPFNLSDQVYSYEFKNPMNFTLKPLGDPYSLAQNITEGGMDFGQTLDDQRRDGLIMIATGTVTFLLCTGSIIGMRYMTVKAMQKKEAAAKEQAQKLNNNGGGGGDDGDQEMQAVAVNPDASHAAAAGAGAAGAAAATAGSNGDGAGNNNGGWNTGHDDDGGRGPRRNPIDRRNQRGNGHGNGWGNGGGNNDDDADFHASNGANKHYNRSTRAAASPGRSGGPSRRHGGYGSGGASRRDSTGDRGTGSGNGSSADRGGGWGGGRSGGGSSGGNSGGWGGGGSGRRNSRNDDNASNRSGGSAQIAQALKRGPQNSSSGRHHHSSRGHGSGRPRSNSRNRQQYIDDPDL